MTKIIAVSNTIDEPIRKYSAVNNIIKEIKITKLNINGLIPFIIHTL